MKVYELFSATFGCNVRLTYNTFGILASYEVMSEALEQVSADTIKLFITESNFKAQAQLFNLKFKEVDRVITFDMFWEKYDYKRDKSLAMAEWNKLTPEEQSLAFDFIWKYERQLKLKPGIDKRYAVRYLKYKTWIE